MEFEDKQAYKTFETGVLVWKSLNMKPYQPIFYFGRIMLKARWRTHVSDGFSFFELHTMQTAYAGR